MATTTTTRQQQQQKRPVPVPLLLEAFPVPPTHIPPTPTTPNPPPTGPPSLPLPPVPGPSRISEHEQLLLLSSMGRRGSRYSNRDSSSIVSPTSPRHRFSVLSTSSTGKSPSLQVAALPRESTDSARSNSRMSVAPGARGRNTPNLLPPPTAEQLTRLSVSPMPLSDIEDDEGRVRAPPRMPSPVLSRRSFMKKHQGNESISEIDFNDILGAVSDVDDTLFSLNAMPAIPSRFNATSTHTHQVSLADPIDPISRTMHLPSQAGVGNYSYPSSSKHSPINSLTNSKEAGETAPYTPRKASQPPTDSLPPLHSPAFGINTTPPTPPADTVSLTAKEIHMEIRATRSSSSSHKRALTARNRSRSTTRGAPVTTSPSEPLPPIPIPPSQDMTLEELGPATIPEKPRSPSPDIVSIISSTPRPLRKSTSRPRVRSTTIERRKLGMEPISRRVSEGSGLHTTTPIGRDGARRLQSDGDVLDSELAYLKDDPSLPRKASVKQRKASDDEDGGSDSSIDIHTPLPHIMVRQGMLSPHSKLLPNTDSRAGTPLDGRPGSMLSVRTNASVVTKSGIIKDERDTPGRRRRHRDGSLLKGGLGLTTGLGWSDSEDEDAPSPLTRRLSAMNLSKRPSSSSILSTRTLPSSHPKRAQHPLSRSYSSGALVEDEDLDVDDFGVFKSREEDRTITGDWGSTPQRRGTKTSLTAPPTSYTSRRSPSANASGSSSVGTRTSTSSAGSMLSLDSARNSYTSRYTRESGSARSSYDVHSTSTSTSGIRRFGASGDETSPSTVSTLSGSLPVTPLDPEMSTGSIGKKARSITTPSGFNKEKSLPPLPAGGLKKSLRAPSATSTAEGNTGKTMKLAAPALAPRLRAYSSASTTPSPAAPATPMSSPGVRPLQLPRHATRSLGNAGDRPAVPVPLVPSMSAASTSSAPYGLRTPRASLRSSTMPSSPTTPTSFGVTENGELIKPRPRTGTGMMYKKSGASLSSTSSASRLRAPGESSIAVSMTASLGPSARR